MAVVGPFLANGTKLQVETTPGGGTYSDIALAVDFSGPASEAAEIDVTTLDDVTGRKYLPGLPDRGDLSVSFLWDPENTFHKQFFTDQVASPPTIRSYRLLWPVSVGGSGTDKYTTTFNAFVKTANRAGGVDAPVNLSVALRITGAVVEASLP